MLAGVQVLVLADPPASYCSRLLTDLGADVVLVEPPCGAVRRRWLPFIETAGGGRLSASFAYYHRGEKSITLDLDTADGRALLHRLLDRVDVLVEGGAPRRLVRWGLQYAQWRERHPEVVMASITPWGQQGERKDWRATDAVAFAAGGLMSVSGRPDLEPVAAPGEQAQVVAGTHAAMGVLTALWARRRLGRGQYVDVSMQAALAAQENLISAAAGEGRATQRSGSQHRVATPGRVYRCRDGYVHFFVSPAQKGAWERLVEWMGNPGVLSGPEWKAGAYRRAHAEFVDGVVGAWARGFSKAELYEEAQRRKIPCAPVNRVSDYAHDPQAVARGFIPTVYGHDAKTLGFPATPWMVNQGRPAGSTEVPTLGQDNDAILGGWLNLTAVEREQLHAWGAL